MQLQKDWSVYPFDGEDARKILWERLQALEEILQLFEDDEHVHTPESSANADHKNRV